MTAIARARILILATDGFEQSELETPLHRLREAGASVDVVTTDGEGIRGFSDGEWGDTVPADMSLSDASHEDYDAIVLPGGQINPDSLRMNEGAVQLVKNFADSGKVVAAICHAPWLLIEAGIVRGREVTSWPSVRTDLKNAGGHVVDKDVAVDNGIITSRNPGDLDAFVTKIVEEIEEGRHKRDAA